MPETVTPLFCWKALFTPLNRAGCCYMTAQPSSSVSENLTKLQQPGVG